MACATRPCLRRIRPGPPWKYATFFSTCRRVGKFLRSESTEYQHIVRMLERLALSRFDVAFTLVHNGRLIWSLPAAVHAADSLQRVAKICGDEFCLARH